MGSPGHLGRGYLNAPCLNQKMETLECRNCGRELRLGDEVVTVQEGVLGPRGVVPLGEADVFCGQECLDEHIVAREAEA